MCHLIGDAIKGEAAEEFWETDDLGSKIAGVLQAMLAVNRDPELHAPNLAPYLNRAKAIFGNRCVGFSVVATRDTVGVQFDGVTQCSVNVGSVPKELAECVVVCFTHMVFGLLPPKCNPGDELEAALTAKLGNLTLDMKLYIDDLWPSTRRPIRGVLSARNRVGASLILPDRPPGVVSASPWMSLHDPPPPGEVRAIYKVLPPYP